jgi:hypothetical protein
MSQLSPSSLPGSVSLSNIVHGLAVCLRLSTFSHLRIHATHPTQAWTAVRNGTLARRAQYGGRGAGAEHPTRTADSAGGESATRPSAAAREPLRSSLVSNVRCASEHAPEELRELVRSVEEGGRFLT